MPVEQAKLNLPSKSGVYLFPRMDGRVMYVGKATNLHSRGRSYFSTKPDSKMIPSLILDSEDIEYIVREKKGIFVSKRDTSSFVKTVKFVMDNYLAIQKNMEKNVLPTKKSMIKQISDIIKPENS